jgi:hypothetical protein
VNIQKDKRYDKDATIIGYEPLFAQLRAIKMSKQHKIISESFERLLICNCYINKKLSKL